MDKVIKRKSNKKRNLILIGIAVLSFGLLGYLSFTKKRTLNVKTSEILIKEVKQAYFEDFIVFQAKVEPLHSMLINVVEGGAVQEIFVENGTMVEKGQALARLYNPNTELGYLTQETAIIEQINNLNVGKLNLRNQELNLMKDLVAIEHDFNNAKNLYDRNKRLIEKGVISQNEWTIAEESYRYQLERKNIIQESIEKEKETNRVQIAQMNQSIATMHKSLEILKENKQNFIVLAPLSGRLSSFDPILGKTYNAGESIGKIDVMKGYKLVAQVDEFYLDKVAVSQKGQVEFKGESVEVQVSRVLPEVKSGRFDVELNFLTKEELALQEGISFGVKLILSEKDQKLVLPKGSFYQETTGNWIFVVNGQKAERRPIKLGKENPYYYEILDGLYEGEKVITSSYKDYKDVEELNLEN
ncbi:MAG: HlyD family efflux transporter periplasmic adaptor subunit [Flavobacteriaceae bacterium]